MRDLVNELRALAAGKHVVSLVAIIKDAAAALEQAERERDQQREMTNAWHTRCEVAQEAKAHAERERDEWKRASLKVGERLSAIGPDGYDGFTADEWQAWALEQLMGLLRKQALRDDADERAYLAHGVAELAMKHRDVAEDENVALRALLRECEWVDGGCPVCQHWEPGQGRTGAKIGHAPDCRLAAELKEGA